MGILLNGYGCDLWMGMRSLADSVPFYRAFRGAAGTAPPRSRRKLADEYRGIHPGIVEADVPMQVRPGGAPGGADRPDRRAARHFLANRDVYARQVAEHADETLTVIQENGLAIEKIIAHEDDLARGRRAHRRACRRGEIQPRMRVAGLPVEIAPQPEWAGQPSGHR